MSTITVNYQKDSEPSVYFNVSPKETDAKIDQIVKKAKKPIRSISVNGVVVWVPSRK